MKKARRILDTATGCDSRPIDALQQEFNLRLPDDFRAFISMHNGGRPEPNTIRIPALDTNVLVDFLFGLGRERQFDILSWTREYRDEMPTGFLVVARDPGGGLFVLDCGEASGIYFWDHQHFFDGSSEADGNTYHITDTFADFLNAIQ